MSEKQRGEKAKAEHELLTGPVWLRPGGQHEQQTHGVKHDSGKPDLSLVPLGLVEGCARAMMFGVDKYGRDNWRGGFADSRLLAACLRHVMAYTNGERVDQESGLCHLDHAAFSLAVVLDQLRERANGRAAGQDDLPLDGQA